MYISPTPNQGGRIAALGGGGGGGGGIPPPIWLCPLNLSLPAIMRLDIQAQLSPRVHPDAQHTLEYTLRENGIY